MCMRGISGIGTSRDRVASNCFELVHSCLQKLPLTVVDLAEQSPSITGDGSPVLGERSSSVYYIHRRTGKLLSTFQSSGASPPAPNLNSTRPRGPRGVGLQDEGGGVQDEGEEGGQEGASLWNMPAADVVAVGRVTYMVEAKHALTRETLWNMTFSRWQHMPLPGGEFDEASLLNVGEGVCFVAPTDFRQRLFRHFCLSLVCSCCRYVHKECTVAQGALLMCTDDDRQDRPWFGVVSGIA